MSLSTDLWDANQDLARASLEHPFVRELADGTLARKRFVYYVGQDSFFLKAFARAYTIAGAKAPDWEGFCALHLLADGVLKELKLHERFAARWNVAIDTVTAGAATRRYTDFVLATAWGQDTGATVVALCPCMRLYAYLGRRLAERRPPEHAYIDWIRTYGDPEVEALARKLEGLADRYASHTPQVREIYRYSMECERDFFQAAYDSVH